MKFGCSYGLDMGVRQTLLDYADSMFEHPPSFWWPEDRTWFASSDIDSSSTYVGGSKELIEQILHDSSLEAFPADLSDPYGGFFMNDIEVEKEYVYARRHFRFGFPYWFPFRRKLPSGVVLYRKRRWWEFGRRP